MKKSYFILAAVAATFAACSQNDVITEITEQEVPIGFTDSWINSATRNAGEMTTTTIQTVGNTMEVWGWKTYNSQNTQIFDNQMVTRESTGANSTPTTYWTYSPLKFWDRTASYKFYAVAPDDDVLSLTEDLSTEANRKVSATAIPAVQVLEDMAGAAKIKLAAADASVTGTASTAVDYLVADVVSCAAGVATQGNATDKDVEFTFHHILSKLTVNVLTTTGFNNTGTTYPQIHLTDLKINLAGMCPEFTQKTAGVLKPVSDTNVYPDCDTWGGTAAGATDYVCFDVDGTKVAESLLLSTTAQKVAAYLVAPTATGATPATCDVKVLVEYDLTYENGAGTLTEHCVSELTTVGTSLNKFVQNNAYDLNITIDPKAIYFDVKTVADWTDASDGAVVVD